MILMQLKEAHYCQTKRSKSIGSISVDLGGKNYMVEYESPRPENTLKLQTGNCTFKSKPIPVLKNKSYFVPIFLV